MITLNPQLYPVTYKGIIYQKKDCHPTFVMFYTSIYALTFDGSVYVGEGCYIYPNGDVKDLLEIKLKNN
jgi:hypothetical protein